MGKIPRRVLLFLGLVLLGVVVLGMTGWCMMMLRHSNLPGEGLRSVVSWAFGAAVLVAFAALKKRRRTLLGFCVAFAVLVVWFLSIPASQDREWSPEYAVHPDATIDGDLVTLRNVRNFDYRTETDFTPRYYDKTYDLKRLESVDLISVYWGPTDIAHVMISFGFGDGDFVCFSIETRREATESFSTTKGFFRQFELFYVVADERDVIALRTNCREPEEDVYIFRLRTPAENRRLIFLDYVRKVAELADEPAWYNTLTHNCTTGVLLHSRAAGGRARYNWKLLFSGYTAEYAYEIGVLDSRVSFEELWKSAHVNAAAHEGEVDEGFSDRIRTGVPKPEAMTLEEFFGE